MNSAGFRGALLFGEGEFQIAGCLKIDQSGIVLRGQSEKRRSILKATGNNRRALVEIEGKEVVASDKIVSVIDSIVSAGATRLHVSTLAGLRPGDRIVIKLV